MPTERPEKMKPACDGNAWPAMMDSRTAARYCASTVSVWRRDRKAGRLPKAMKRGNKFVWRRADIDAWIAVGCPPLDADAAAAYAALLREQLDALSKRRPHKIKA